MLARAIAERRGGLRFYGLTPPKRGQEPAKVRAIAQRQVERIAGLAPDGLILYDLQDETARTGAERPFPFLPTLEPLDYAREYLAELAVPRVIYKCVGNLGAAEFLRWIDAFAAPPGRDALVLVGAPSSLAPTGGLGLREAHELLRSRGRAVCRGGVAIAERHARRIDEDARLLAKVRQGCGFFVSQTVYDAQATRSLLSDYALRFAAEGLAPVPFIVSLAPCGSIKTMEFMKWLGVSFPRWLENDLRHSADILQTSVELAVKLFAELREYAGEKGIPLGVNVESVSIRREEIEAACELFARLSGALGGGGGVAVREGGGG